MRLVIEQTVVRASFRFVLDGAVEPIRIRDTISIAPHSIGISVVDGKVESYSISGPRILKLGRCGDIMTADKFDVRRYEQNAGSLEWISKALRSAEAVAKESSWAGMRYL
jgi:hypothetical protein